MWVGGCAYARVFMCVPLCVFVYVYNYNILCIWTATDERR